MKIGPVGFLAMRFIGGVKGLASGKLGLVNTPGGEGLLVSSSARTIRVLVGITSFCS
ncbi:MAG: hypothetical protein LBB80_05400 [Treponema sp.]|jgi:hypothetical protein|nr:hypothetical protein [Treponema sp.]